jgi:hypothetical protein
MDKILSKEELLARAAELNRKELQSVDLSDIEEIDKQLLTEAEMFERASATEIFYSTHLRNVIKLFVQEQLEEIGMKTPNESYLFFNRGTINGLSILDDWCKRQVSVSMSKRGDKEEPPKLGHI